ncbi:MAG: hypothetical protein CSA45_00825 [Gammaproteobacteria bacterium]|nr:MAG: hypothetical protein CSA45_00825 [Gammaproteobacteria bacterium]
MDIEQSTLIWITRIVFFVIAAIIAFGVWRFMRRERLIAVSPQPVYQPPRHITLPKKQIILTVIAKPGHVFDNMHLFKVMRELGFEFSDNQIFGYFIPNRPEEIAFRIVNIKKPYTFDKNPQNMRSTNGIVAVMDFPVGDGDNQVAYFHLLLSVLDEICTNLNATLCDMNRNPIRDQKLYAIQEEIESFEQNYLSLIQNDYQYNSQ